VLGILTLPTVSHVFIPVYSIYCIAYFMVLTYVILVDSTISYREIFFLANGIWATLCSPLYVVHLENKNVCAYNPRSCFTLAGESCGVFSRVWTGSWCSSCSKLFHVVSVVG